MLHPPRLSGPSRDESYFPAHSAKKNSTLKPLTVWIFAAVLSPPKTGNRILQPCPCFRPLHFSGKNACTAAAVIVSLCRAARPAPPPTSNKEQNDG